MKRLKFLFLTKLKFTQPISEHHFVLRCVPQALPEQQIADIDLHLLPKGCGGVFDTDSFGNQLFSGSMLMPHTSFYYRIKGVIERDDTLREVEMPLPCLKYPTRLTQPSDGIKAMANELRQGELADALREQNNYAIATKISDILYKTFTYAPGSTTVTTTAADAFAEKQGVCQDYVHVFLSLVRLFGIPARYVSGLPYGEGATHAWAEIWHEGKWYGLDPTRGCVADEGYIKLNVGRDFNDCPIERGVFRGTACQLQTTYMKVDIIN